MSSTYPNFLKAIVEPENHNIDIVAVHGLNPINNQFHAEETWKAGDRLWLKDFLPRQLPNARVLLFGYNSNVAFATADAGIQDHALNLLNWLWLKRGDDGRPIVFVAHSLGGIIVKEALVVSIPDIYRPIRNATRGIAFFATPHQGGNFVWIGEILTRIVNIIPRNPRNRLLRALARDSEILEELSRAFSRRLENYQYLSFYETLPYSLGRLIVETKSAVLGARREIPILMEKHHVNICKFATEDGPDYVQVSGNLVRLVTEVTMPVGNPSPSSALSQQHDPMFLVPYAKNPELVWRDEIFDRLKDILAPNGGEDSWSRTHAVLFGSRGVGKSQIAIQYAYYMQEHYPDCSVFWVNGSNIASFRAAYQRISEEYMIPGRDDPETDKLALVRRWLERKQSGKWLMIIDDVDAKLLFGPHDETTQASLAVEEAELGIAQYIPECSNGSVLVTTPEKSVAIYFTGTCIDNMLEVKRMSRDESIKLIRKKLLYPIDFRSAEAEDLSSRLENLPIALVQATAYMQKHSLEPSEYLQLYDKALATLPSVTSGTTGSDFVMATWMVSFTRVKANNQLAAHLLSIMAFFESEGIPESLLWVEGEPPAAYLTEALDVLKTLALIIESKEGFDMHRTVQVATRNWLAENQELEKWSGLALENVSKVYHNARSENRKSCARYLAHAEAVLQHCSSSPSRLTLLSDVAWYLSKLGRWKEAEKHQREVMETRLKDFGPEHLDTLTSKNNLASTLWSQGLWTKAEELHQQVFDARKRLLGAEHPDTLTSMNNLASTLWSRGRWTEAEELHQQVLDERERLLGAEHPDTLTSKANLASTFWSQGRWTEAEELHQQVLDERERLLGAEHPDTLISKANLASTLSSEGRYKEAEDQETQIVETRKKVLKAEHPHTLTSVNNLAWTYQNQGRWREAEELRQQVLKARKKVLGIEHPDTLTSMNNLASTLWSRGLWTKAEELHQEALKARGRLLGAENPDTLTSKANLASTFWSQGRWTEAEELHQQVLELRKRLLGAKHPDTLNSKAKLALTFQSQGRVKEAKQLGGEAMEERKEVLGAEHPDTLTSIHDLALTYQKQGRLGKAEELHQQVLKVRKRLLGAKHPDTLNSKAKLALTFQSQGRVKEAEQLGGEAMEERKEVLGAEHPDTLTSIHDLALTYQKQGRLEEAKELAAEALQARIKVLGAKHPDTLASRKYLASAYKN